jgi:hypothetical protein
MRWPLLLGGAALWVKESGEWRITAYDVDSP